MKFKIFKFKNVTSTNDVALNLIQKEKKTIGCVCADVQTKGRGTHGRKWISDKGNLFGTLFFPLENNYPAFNEFSIINPVILSGVIEKYCKKKNISFKWPNDVLVNKKKICGILQEKIEKSKKEYLIVGIGFNLIKSPNIPNYPTTNLLKITNQKINKKKFVKELKITLTYIIIEIKFQRYIFTVLG